MRYFNCILIDIYRPHTR